MRALSNVRKPKCLGPKKCDVAKRRREVVAGASEGIIPEGVEGSGGKGKEMLLKKMAEHLKNAIQRVIVEWRRRR